RADADAHVVHDGAGVDDAAMADGDARSDDARELGRDVEHRVVLDIGVPAERDVVVLVAPEHAEGPDARSLLDRHVADDLRRRVDVRALVDARLPPGHLADHGAAAPALDEAPLAHQIAPRLRSASISPPLRPSSARTASVSSPRRGAPL